MHVKRKRYGNVKGIYYQLNSLYVLYITTKTSSEKNDLSRFLFFKHFYKQILHYLKVVIAFK